jgi:hypothetical protein
MAPTATFYHLMKAEGQFSLWSINQPLWLQQPPHGIPTPRSKNEGGREKGRESVNEIPETNDSLMIRYFRMYPCISPMQKGRYRDIF